jgi:hypothetical protein
MPPAKRIKRRRIIVRKVHLMILIICVVLKDAVTHVKISFQFGVLFPDPLQPSHQEHAHFCLILSIFFF